MRKNALTIVRVSSDNQQNSTSPEVQREWVTSIVEEENLNVVMAIDETVQGFILPKKYYDEILKVADETGIDYIVVIHIDRFSRIFSYGSILLEKLHEKNKIKIITAGGTYDFDKSQDRFLVGLFLVLAEQEQGRRLDGIIRSMCMLLKRGEWPLAPPCGYNSIKNNKEPRLVKKEWCDEVINAIFDTFINIKNKSRTARIINEKYEKIIGEHFTGARVDRIIQESIYLGYLRWRGELFGDEEKKPRKELKVITQEKFDEAQRILLQIKKRYRRDFDSNVEELMDEYGVHPVIDICGLMIPCPKCDSIEKVRNGKGQLKSGIPQSTYICNKCDHEWRFPAYNQIKRIEKIVAYPCRNCNVKDQHVLKTDEAGNWELKCKNCGLTLFLYEYRDTHNVSIEKNNAVKERVINTNDKKQSSLNLFDSDSNSSRSESPTLDQRVEGL